MLRSSAKSTTEFGNEDQYFIGDGINLPNLDKTLTTKEAEESARAEGGVFLEGRTNFFHWTNPTGWRQEGLVTEVTSINKSERFSGSDKKLTHFGQKFSTLFEKATKSAYRFAVALVVVTVMYKASCDSGTGKNRVINSLKAFISSEG